MQQENIFTSIAAIEKNINQQPHAISLAQGAMKASGIACAIKEHMKQMLDTTATDYYQPAAGIPSLRQSIAHSFNQSLTSNHVLVTHGAMGALSILLSTLLKPDDEVILPEPTYAAYHEGIKLRGAQTRWVSLLNNQHQVLAEEQWLPTIKLAYTSKTKMLILSNPGNPLGTVLKKETLQELVDWCEEHKIYLVVDEVYRHYIFQGCHHSAASYVPTHRYVIMIDSFSKSYAMSGWRIGYLLAHHELIERLTHIQHIILNCANGFAQQAALYAVAHPECIEPLKKQLHTNHILLSSRIAELNAHGLVGSLPAGGFFILLSTKQPGMWQCINILSSFGVGLVPGSLFGPSASHMVRLCFARPYTQLITALDRLTRNLHVS